MLWAARECGHAAFGDARLVQRLITLVATLSERPASSLPTALGKWSDTKAAYRFLDNKRVTPAAIYQGHRKATLKRAKGHSVLLAVQDTTVFNFTLHRETEGLGPIGQQGLSGFFLHSCLGVSANGVPLGILAHRMWVRPPAGKDSRRTHRARPLADKESARWLETTREAVKSIPPATRVVMIGDRESDLFDLFLMATGEHYDILVRAAWNRRLDSSGEYLWDGVEKTPVLGQVTVMIPRSGAKQERPATLTLQAARVTIRPPQHRKQEQLPASTLNAVLVRELAPPEGAEKVEWLLLTTLATSTFQQTLQCLTWYTYRWRIERYHYILKSGCRIEKLQLETAQRLMRALALYSIVAWRLLWVTYHARQTPAAPCTVALTAGEWRALYAATHKTAAVPDRPPDLKTAVRWIAQLGGFLGRKGDGEPGVKVLWRGFRRLEDLTIMWEIFHPP